MTGIVAVDVGGTFTDLVGYDGSVLRGRKVPTTSDQAQAVIEVMDGHPADTVFLHGTTVGTNALIEDRLARVALVTSPGFEDLIEIGRQARPSLYDVFADRPEALVPRSLRLPVGDVDDLVRRFDGAEAVAVALVDAYQDPDEEIALAAALTGRTGLPVSAGALVSPGFREYERIATTALNAALTPVVSGYLGRLGAGLGMRRKLVMTSAGGLLPFDAALEQACRLLLSGPAAGVVAAAALGRLLGYENVLSLDMGGTSTDVCRIGEAAAATTRVQGRVNRVPSLPVRTIGAGGGSVAWVDTGGALRVGPMSAGARPGPACYGFGGTLPTVTDANLVLGRIPGDAALGGAVALEEGAAWRVMTGLGESLGMDAEPAALGVIEVVEAEMGRALRLVSVEEGVDPRRSALVAFGGAAGLHATPMARRLGVGTVLVPPLSGVFSALGLLLAPPRVDVTRTVLLRQDDPGLEAAARAVRAEGRRRFAAVHGGGGTEQVVAAMRYTGQSHELELVLPESWNRGVFDLLHQERFGFARPDWPVEVVDLRAEVAGTPPFDLSLLPEVGGGPAPAPASGRVMVAGRWREIPIWERSALPAGFETDGPGLVVEPDTVVLLDRGDGMTVDPSGTLVIRT